MVTPWFKNATCTSPVFILFFKYSCLFVVLLFVFIRGSAFCVYSWFYFVGFQNLNFISVHTASIPSDHLIFFPSSMERGL